MTDDSDRVLDRITRRNVLKGSASAIVGVSLAGCSGSGDGGGDGGGGDGGDGGGGGGGDGGGETTTSGDGGGDGGDGGGETTTSGDGGDGGDAMGGGKLKIAQAKSPIEFDPIVLNDVPSGEVTQLIFSQLYDYDSGTKLVPELAAGQPEVSKGAKRWTIPIRDDAEFQNGDPVTAEDVKYSLVQPVAENTENAGEVNMIDSVTVVDEKTAQIDLKFPFAPFKHNMASRSIVPKSVRSKQVSYTTNDKGNKVVDKNEFASNPVGSGPYKFVGFTEGEFARVERWDDYWGDPMPNLAEVEFVPVEEGTTRITTLKTGENDVIKTIPPKSWPTVETMGKARIEAVPAVTYFYLAFNCKKGPTADPQVRKAIDHAFSMDDAVSKFVEPSGVRQYSPIPRSMAEDWNFPIQKFKEIPSEKNVEKAKSMLDGSDSVPGDWKAKIIVPPDDKREQIGVTVANGLKEAGYKASVQRLDWGPFLQKYITGNPKDYNMYTLGWLGNPDPDTFMYHLLAQETFGVTNGCFYKNDSVDEKIMNARRSNNREKRQQWYEDAILTILEDRAHLPAYGLKNSWGVRSRVKDFKAHPVNGYSIVSGYNNVSVQ